MGQRVCKVVLLALLSVGLPLGASAQDASPPAPPSTADLPVTKVVLCTTGVGDFDHSGTVTGTERLDLPVAADQMDDLLQSLVVEDAGGGTVRPVRYPSQDPLGRILAGYTLDLSHDPGLADLLSQARGQRVHLEAGQSLDGTVVNVERVPLPDGPPSTRLTLLTAAGLQRIDLDEVRSVRFDDPTVQADLEAALAAIARTRRNDASTVQLLFEGQGTRHVRVGYVREMPVWKTSYRLVLQGDGTADLQGWAIVDNPTDLDLTDVQMTFVAGQPISFVAGLYDPIYRQRPHVALELAQGIVPRAYAGESAPAAKSTDSVAAPAPAERAVGGLAQAPAAPQLRGAGVEAKAQFVGTGATFQYRVDQPVTVARHESAMIPIVLETVHARPLSVVDPTVLSAHPLRGVRLVNDTGLHLAAGPVTVYDAGGFTGDTRISDIVPGDDRVLTYAVDLGVDVSTTGSSTPERVTAVSLTNGMLVATAKQRLTTTYTLTARDGEARFLVLEHPKRSGYTMVAPTQAPAETAQSYRLGVALAGSDQPAPAGDSAVPTVLQCDAGGPCTLDVVLERTVKRTVAISNVASSDIATYLENVELSADDRATLTQVLDLKQQLADLDRRIADHRSRIDAIFQDQDRIRRNMAALDRTSALYRRYASDLQSQENELQTLRSETTELQAQRTTLQGRLDALLRSLGSGS
ncbi:MAG: hypothetical protein P8Y13_04530 [Deinococcales bacterium]